MKWKFAVMATVVLLGVGTVTFFWPNQFTPRVEILPTPSITPIATHSSTPTAKPIASATPTVSTKPLSLLCFDTGTKKLRMSDVDSGCRKTERSLGASAIKRPAIRPTDINPYLKTRFLAAQAAGKKLGYPLAITSGFRSYTLQAFLFRNAVEKYGSEAEASKWVLPPDISHHPWGLALDINYPNDPKSTKWLEINGYKYGLCRAYENEWWHFEGLVAPGKTCPQRLTDASEEPE